MPRAVAVVAVVMGVAIVVAAGAWLGNWFGRLGGPGAGGSEPVSNNHLDFEVPAGWEVNTTGWPSTGMGSTFAIVGTQPWGPCQATDLNCHYQQRLGPGQITVNLALGGFVDDFCEVGATRSDLAARGAQDPPAIGKLLRVDGRPTIRTDYAVGRHDFYL